MEEQRVGTHIRFPSKAGTEVEVETWAPVLDPPSYRIFSSLPVDSLRLQLLGLSLPWVSSGSHSGGVTVCGGRQNPRRNGQSTDSFIQTTTRISTIHKVLYWFYERHRNVYRVTAF